MHGERIPLMTIQPGASALTIIAVGVIISAGCVGSVAGIVGATRVLYWSAVVIAVGLVIAVLSHSSCYPDHGRYVGRC
jgi:hypothetical protein